MKRNTTEIHSAFRTAAIEAVLQFRFKPAEQSGKPVAVWMTSPVEFKANAISSNVFDLGEFAINPPKTDGKVFVQLKLALLPANAKAERVFKERIAEIQDRALGKMISIPLEQWNTPQDRAKVNDVLKKEINDLLRDHLVVQVFIPMFVVSGQGTDANTPTDVVTDFKLHTNFPNPFNPETSIKYDLAEAKFVTLDIHTLTGQVIRTLVSKNQSAGRYQVRWDGKDDKGRPVASGTYYYNLKTDQFSDVKKMQLLK